MHQQSTELYKVIPSGWSVLPAIDGLRLVAPNSNYASDLLRGAKRSLKQAADRMGIDLWICSQDQATPIKRIRASRRSQESYQDDELRKPFMSDRVADLLGADYVRLHEFLMAARQEGKIVIITSNVTRDADNNPISTENPAAGRDICHHTNDLLLPSRAYWSAHQFTGYNYRLSWRRDRNDYEHLNPEYHHLKELLARDGQAPGYEYKLFRPDGALCSYKTDYYLCRDYCGDEVRIGVSSPNDWQLLEPAEI